MCRLSFIRVLKSAVFVHSLSSSLPLLPPGAKTICFDIVFECISIVSFRLDHHWKLTNSKILYFGCSNIKSYLSNSVFVSIFVLFYDFVVRVDKIGMKNKTEKAKMNRPCFSTESSTCCCLLGHASIKDEMKKTIKLGSKNTASNSISSTVQNYSKRQKKTV